MSIRAIKGTKDILPKRVWRFRRLETAARKVFKRYGYREIRTPLFEATELFARGIGRETDIVSKEMYTFEDRDGDSLTLRPEATAGIVRAVIQHVLLTEEPILKVYLLGPMFRRERPQKGRYRQFHQVDVEAFGVAEPALDAEVITMAMDYIEECKISGHHLILNSVGDSNCRPAYLETLRAALRSRAASMCSDCQRRSETNPLRVLDCKVPEDQPILEALPRISDHLCPECRDHFAEVRHELDLLGIPYRVSHRLVRGLDYYTRTTFEIVCGGLGAQDTVLGGGRYDGLVQELGGPDACGIGFAAGLERLAELLPEPRRARRCQVFLVPLSPMAFDRALLLQRKLRQAGFSVLMDHEGRSFKARMKLADKLGARYALILGESELQKGVWSVRDMAGSAQEEVAEAGIVDYLLERLAAPRAGGGRSRQGVSGGSRGPSRQPGQRPETIPPK